MAAPVSRWHTGVNFPAADQFCNGIFGTIPNRPRLLKGFDLREAVPAHKQGRDGREILVEGMKAIRSRSR